LMLMLMLMLVLVPVLMFVVVMMGMVVIIVVVRMLVLQMHVKFGAGDLRARGLPGVQMVFLQPQLLQFSGQLIKIHSKIQHRANEHVAADPTEDVQINGPHSSRLLSRLALLLIRADGFNASTGRPFPATPAAASAARALIWLAAHPAPKPLLMFTTVKPLAQLVNIPNRGVNPPRWAPYPTLVGTAMTGRPIKPPT